MAGANMRSDERRGIFVSFDCEAVAATLAKIVKFRVGKLRSEPVCSRVFAPIRDELFPKFGAGGTVGHFELIMRDGHSTQCPLSHLWTPPGAQAIFRLV